MFVVNYPLFLPVCRLIMDQSIKSCTETSPSLMVSVHYSLISYTMLFSSLSQSIWPELLNWREYWQILNNIYTFGTTLQEKKKKAFVSIFCKHKICEYSGFTNFLKYLLRYPTISKKNIREKIIIKKLVEKTLQHLTIKTITGKTALCS